MRPKTFQVFLGYDSREPVAYHVAAHSILRRSSVPISVTPVAKRHLRWYTRDTGPTEATEFSMTRFLVPFLCGYQGWAVFMDCDMLCQVDIVELQLEILGQQDKAVLVCQHDYEPKMGPKFLGQEQTSYPRKNWSSFMVFNANLCRKLTPEYVNDASGLDLHRFHWLRHRGEDETARIGTLPLEWNWLVGEYPANPDAKILHFTRGGPWFREYASCDHAELWFQERDIMQSAGIEAVM